MTQNNPIVLVHAAFDEVIISKAAEKLNQLLIELA